MAAAGIFFHDRAERERILDLAFRLRRPFGIAMVFLTLAMLSAVASAAVWRAIASICAGSV